MTDITLIEAITQALAYEMNVDPDVVVLGEDIATNGGVFRATVGLLEKFGPERVMDTPLAESMIAGAAIGMAAQGLKPVAEFQFVGFIYPALDQLFSHAARMRNRTRGRLTCPMVVRAPYGGGIHAPEHHSESPEALFAHTPGFKVVIPSSPARAYGLLLAAIRDPDPVIYLEPSRIYRLVKQNVPNDGHALPIGKCFLSREGTDVTLISWGASLHETNKAATTLALSGITADVIDVATISPLDIDTILTSVEKTGRCVIVHEAPRSAGIGADIAAQISEKALLSLLAPIERVTGYDITMPYPKMEHAYLPTEQRIIAAVQKTLEFK
jgi:pyruvate dehydrogenase E1 component beta subunit